MTDEIDIGEPETRSVQAKPITRPTPIIYANQVQLATTPWDIQMIFSQLRETRVSEAVTEELVTVVMSPVHAKVMAQILSNQVVQYEAQFGIINLNLQPPPEQEKAEAGSKPAKRRSKK